MSSGHARVGVLKELRVPGVACTGSQHSTMVDQGLLSLHPTEKSQFFFKGVAPKVNLALVGGPTSWLVRVIQIGFTGLLKVCGGH